MAQNSSKKGTSKSIDATGSNPSRWYLDFHLPNGGIDDRVHLFFQDRESTSFKNCGIAKELKKDCSDLDMTPCLGVKILGKGDSYLLEPVAFAWDLVKANHRELTMSKAGWVELGDTTPSENFIDLFIEGFKKVTKHLEKLRSKKRKGEDQGELNQSKIPREGEATSVGNTTIDVEKGNLMHTPLEMQEVGDANLPTTPAMAVVADLASITVLDSIAQPKKKDLDREVAKTSKSGLDGYVGLEHYFKFGVQFTHLVNVDLCNIAPEAYKCRSLSKEYVNYLLKQFARHSRPVSNAADLMPYDPITKLPLKTNEVQEDKLSTYHYWILSGQHSIVAARCFLRNNMPEYSTRKEFYKFRIARVVVDAPKEIVVRISKMENIETQTAMKTQPYLEVLKHGLGQWIAYGCPSRPKAGVPSNHESQKDWNAFVQVANITFNHSTFALKEAHMVMYKDDIYDQWISILEKHQASTARGRQPTITTFRCLRGLDDDDVKLLQCELLEGKICLVKQPNQRDMLDLSARSTDIKLSKVFVSQMLTVFKELDPAMALTSWDECRSHYNITDEIHKSLYTSCLHWLQIKLQQTKETPTFPEVTKRYVQWIIAQKNGTSHLQFSLPWSIRCVGQNLEGIESLCGESSSPMNVGVCIIDTTHKNLTSSGWSALQFGKVIDGVCGVAHQPSEFVIVGLVKFQHAASLEKAVSEKAKWYAVHVLPLSSLVASETVQTTALREVIFGVWAFFSQGEEYTNYSTLKDSLLQPMHTLAVDSEEYDAMLMAKSFFVQRAIKSICVKENDQVVDVLSLGYGTKEALQQQRKVLSVVCTNDQLAELETLCHTTVDEDVELKRWANREDKDTNDSHSSQKNGEKAPEDERPIETLEASAKALLDDLLNSG